VWNSDPAKQPNFADGSTNSVHHNNEFDGVENNEVDGVANPGHKRHSHR